MSGTNKRKAVFLDRDGVVNRELGDYVKNVGDFELLPFVADNCRKLQYAGFLLILITNQGGIAKGLYSAEELAGMHAKLQASLKENGVTLTDIFHCPHHPDFGKCLCRKPESLMLEKAIARYELDAAACYMIGDTQRDIDAAHGAGVRAFLTASNANWGNFVDEILHAQNFG